MKSSPATWLALNFTLHILLFGLATITHNSRITVRISDWRVHQEVILGVNLVFVRQQLFDQGRARFPIFGELAGSEKQTRSTIAQDIDVIDLLALQLRHFDRIHLGRSRFTALEQLARILALAVSATKILTEASCLQLHFAAALVTLQNRTVIALDLELTLFDFKATTVGIITAYV